MRVLMLSLDRGFFGEGSSGDTLQRHRAYADLAGALDVIVFAPGEYERKDWSHNFRVFPTRSKKHRHYRNAVAIARSLGLEKKYDLLVTQDFTSPAGVLIKQVLKTPLIVSIHSMFFSSQWLGTNPLNWYLYYRIKKALIHADAFRVTNEIIKKQIEAWGLLQPVLVLPTPVDVEKFKVQSAKLKMTMQPPHPPSPSKTAPPDRGEGEELKDGVKILYVGRLAPEKNLGVLIGAFKNLSTVIATPPSERGKQSITEIATPLDKLKTRDDIELWIVGEGPERDRLEKLAFVGDQRGSSFIKFLGPKSTDELIPIYQQADIFVLPSDTESFGKVLIEAGAAGCVLVATKTTGAQAIIEDGKNGLLIPVNDQRSLAEVLVKLSQDPKLCERLSQSAQAMATRFDAKKSTQRLVDFWKEVSNANQRMDSITTNNSK